MKPRLYIALLLPTIAACAMRAQYHPKPHGQSAPDRAAVADLDATGQHRPDDPLAAARFRTTIRSGASSITVGGVIQFRGLYPPASAWTSTEPSAFTMIRRSASGNRASRRPE